MFLVNVAYQKRCKEGNSRGKTRLFQITMALKQMEKGGTGMRTPLQGRFQGSLGAEVSGTVLELKS